MQPDRRDCPVHSRSIRYKVRAFSHLLEPSLPPSQIAIRATGFSGEICGGDASRRFSTRGEWPAVPRRHQWRVSGKERMRSVTCPLCLHDGNALVDLSIGPCLRPLKYRRHREDVERASAQYRRLTVPQKLTLYRTDFKAAEAMSGRSRRVLGHCFTPTLLLRRPVNSIPVKIQRCRAASRDAVRRTRAALHPNCSEPFLPALDLGPGRAGGRTPGSTAFSICWPEWPRPMARRARPRSARSQAASRKPRRGRDPNFRGGAGRRVLRAQFLAHFDDE